MDRRRARIARRAPQPGSGDLVRRASVPISRTRSRAYVQPRDRHGRRPRPLPARFRRRSGAGHPGCCWAARASSSSSSATADWIERAFEAHREAMKTVSIGPEQSFCARFVEKAMRVSFILPALGPRPAARFCAACCSATRQQCAEPCPAMDHGQNGPDEQVVERIGQGDDRIVREQGAGRSGAQHGPGPGRGDRQPRRRVQRCRARRSRNDADDALASRIVTSTDFETEVICRQLEPLAPVPGPTHADQADRQRDHPLMRSARSRCSGRISSRTRRSTSTSFALWVIIMTGIAEPGRCSPPSRLVDLLCEAAPKKRRLRGEGLRLARGHADGARAESSPTAI